MPSDRSNPARRNSRAFNRRKMGIYKSLCCRGLTESLNLRLHDELTVEDDAHAASLMIGGQLWKQLVEQRAALLWFGGSRGALRLMVMVE